MSVKLQGFNYSIRDILTYSEASLPREVRIIAHDQAKFNFTYLVFMSEIDEHGLSVVTVEFAKALDTFVHTRTRNALYLLPLKFMSAWGVLVPHEEVSNHITAGVFPQDMHARMITNANTLQARMVVTDRNVVSLDFYRKMRNE